MTTEIPEVKITRRRFYFETPLYELIKSSEIEDDLFTGQVDAYSSINGIETTYDIKRETMDQYSTGFEYERVTLKCRRKDNDILKFFIVEGEDFVMKIGQWPSLADIQFAELGKKYDKFLSRGELQDYKKAIGLAAHGVGAGSFVYLRRIFEKLIADALVEHKAELILEEQDFLAMRMADKVDTLRLFLPPQMVAMKKIYSILSQGVHELSEQECLEYFGVLKLSIELILDQKIELEAKQVKDNAVKRQVEAINVKLGGTKK
jgi:hypothetical protein